MVFMGQQATVLCTGRGKCKGPPRGLRPCRASHGDYVVTREIRQSDKMLLWGGVCGAVVGGGVGPDQVFEIGEKSIKICLRKGVRRASLALKRAK